MIPKELKLVHNFRILVCKDSDPKHPRESMASELGLNGFMLDGGGGGLSNKDMYICRNE